MGLRRAFTLIEILGVLALLALVSSLAVLNFSVFDARGARPPAKELKSVIKRARLEAFYSGVETALYYDSTSGDFSIRRYETGDEIFNANILGDTKDAAARRASAPPAIEFKPVFSQAINTFSSSFDVIEVLPCLRFYPDGSSSEALIIIKGSGKAERLYLNPFLSVPVEEGGANVR